MKRIPLFLVLTLMAAWGYTSWYWYTCNIKGACVQTHQQEQTELTEAASVNQNETAENDINFREVDTQVNSGGEVRSLSRDDVLVGDSVIPQAPIGTNEVNSREEETIDDEIDETLSQESSQDTSSGSIVEEIQDDGEESVGEEVASSDLCTSPLVGPISIAGGNNSADVVKLETFLIANAYLSSSDGVYGNADFEAVKQLQLDYKAQMLDPWGIDAPTGYVGKTTVATINSIGCKN